MNRKMRKPVKGETLYSLNVGNAARGVKQELTPVEVLRVGRKYFYTTRRCSWGVNKYEIETWQDASGYSANSVLYETELEWLEEKESIEIIQEIRKAFDYGVRKKFTIDQLRSIRKIMNCG